MEYARWTLAWWCPNDQSCNFDLFFITCDGTFEPMIIRWRSIASINFFESVIKTRNQEKVSIEWTILWSINGRCRASTRGTKPNPFTISTDIGKVNIFKIIMHITQSCHPIVVQSTMLRCHDNCLSSSLALTRKGDISHFEHVISSWHKQSQKTIIIRWITQKCWIFYLYFERALQTEFRLKKIKLLGSNPGPRSPGFGRVSRVIWLFPIHIMRLVDSDKTLKNNVTEIITTRKGIVVIFIVFNWHNRQLLLGNQSEEQNAIGSLKTSLSDLRLLKSNHYSFHYRQNDHNSFYYQEHIHLNLFASFSGTFIVIIQFQIYAA